MPRKMNSWFLPIEKGEKKGCQSSLERLGSKQSATMLAPSSDDVQSYFSSLNTITVPP
jgi:hypothetical protein